MKILTENRIFRRLFSGFVIWLIPFCIALLFYGPGGTLRIDLMLFKSIMIVVASVTASVMMVWYFQVVRAGYTIDAILTGILWLVENWALDIIVLVGVFGTPSGQYFMETGIRYLMIPAIVIATGMVADKAVRKNASTVKGNSKPE